jgi:hypothetical protein
MTNEMKSKATTYFGPCYPRFVPSGQTKHGFPDGKRPSQATPPEHELPHPIFAI